MDKRSIIKQLLEKGMLVSPELLGILEEKDVGAISAKDNSMVITTLDAPSLKISYRKTKAKNRLTIDDFAMHYKNRYEAIKQLLLKKIPSTVSINKAINEKSKVSVIGMVREVTPQGFILDDTTGEISVNTKTHVVVDDVIGVTGTAREDMLIAEEIVYPDIQISRKIGIINATVVLAIRQHNEMTITPSSSPQYIEISQGPSRVNMLAYKPKAELSKNQATDILKKRHISPQMDEMGLAWDAFVIDPIPEIFWIISGSKWSHIYKGVLILSCMSAKINLNTKEFEFLD